MFGRRSVTVFSLTQCGFTGCRRHDIADAVVPRLRYAAKRQHSTLPRARPDRRRRAPRGVLRGAAASPGSRAGPTSTSTPSATRTSSSGLHSGRCPTAPPARARFWHPETYGEYLAWALEEGTTPNGVFGAKLMWGYLGDFAELLRGIEGMSERTLPDLLARSFPGLPLHPDHAPGQGPPGRVAVEGGCRRRRGSTTPPADSSNGVQTRLSPSGRSTTCAAADRPRRLVGRLLPRPRL